MQQHNYKNSYLTQYSCRGPYRSWSWMLWIQNRPVRTWNSCTPFVEICPKSLRYNTHIVPRCKNTVVLVAEKAVGLLWWTRLVRPGVSRFLQRTHLKQSRVYRPDNGSGRLKITIRLPHKNQQHRCSWLYDMSGFGHNFLVTTESSSYN